MQHLIGEIAGEIWTYLNSNGKDSVSVTSLTKKINRKKDEIMLGAGWLAREGKLNLEETGTSIKISLNPIS